MPRKPKVADGPAPRPYCNPDTLYMPDGRPCLRPEEKPKDGPHYLQPRAANPYAPSVLFRDGKPVSVDRHAAYAVTAESVERVLKELGWEVKLGPWHAAWSTDPCIQTATVWLKSS